MADRFQNAVDLLRNSFAGVPPLLRQEQGTFVPLGAGIAQEEAVGLQIVHRAGNGGLVLLAMLAQLRRGHAAQRINVVQAGRMDASEMIGGHLLIFDFPYVAADPVDQNSKSLKSLLHDGPPLLQMLKFQQAELIT